MCKLQKNNLNSPSSLPSWPCWECSKKTPTHSSWEQGEIENGHLLNVNTWAINTSEDFFEDFSYAAGQFDPYRTMRWRSTTLLYRPDSISPSSIFPYRSSESNRKEYTSRVVMWAVVLPCQKVIQLLATSCSLIRPLIIQFPIKFYSGVRPKRPFYLYLY